MDDYAHKVVGSCQRLFDGSSHDATLTIFNEVVDEVSLIALSIATLDLYECLAVVQSALVQDAVDVVDEEDLLIGEAPTTQSHDVDATVDDGISTDETVRRDVFGYLRASLYHNVLGYAYELMHQYGSTEYSIVVYLDLSSELCRIPQDDVILQYAVVCHMRVSHDETVTTYLRGASGGCTSIDGNKFTDSRAITDDCCRLFATELQVLRYTRYDGIGMYVAVVSDASTATYHTALVEDAAIAYDGVCFDRYVSPDGHVCAYLRLWMDLSKGRDIRLIHALIML